ncbi:hypothetical protein AB4Y63_12165 [Leifsonia sp. YAF41]|uniref:hypothetical protein n=1 Tax=Leifsonia sp. YAF41 TaxID=3233086 RepID=UPI003F9AE4A6
MSTTRVCGIGIGALFVAGITKFFDPFKRRRIALSTKDARGLYAKFGFPPLAGA